MIGEGSFVALYHYPVNCRFNVIYRYLLHVNHSRGEVTINMNRVSKTLIIIGLVMLICAIIGLFLAGWEEVEPGHYTLTGAPAIIIIFGVGGLGVLLMLAGAVYHWVK